MPTPLGSSPTRSREELVTWLRAYIAEALHLTPGEIDIHEPFVSYGLTSKDAVFLSGELGDWLGRDLSPTLVWEHPTIDAVSRHLGREPGAAAPAAPEPPVPAPAVTSAPEDGIAIISLGCRFPGAPTPEAFWALLQRGGDAITEVPASRWEAQRFYNPDSTHPGTMNTLWGGFLEQVDEFDPLFFGISPREATRMDPQQRLLLEVAWEALERGGQAPHALQGTRTGVFVGISSNDYSQRQFSDRSLLDAYAGTGNAHSIAANRLSYLLGLRGPSMAVDTACSSSLVSLHLACQSLRQGECDLALAGGVNVILNPDLTIAFSRAGMMAKDGRCKTFDAAADGYVRSEGCGIVVLKRLADARASGDPILAVIHGSAVNHDGLSNGLTAPNGVAQQDVIRQALQQARLTSEQISYVEAHGTGTSLGDPIEVEALKGALMAGRASKKRCLLGSAKSNIGHLESAAGIAGLTKVVLALQHGEIPPQVHFKKLNPHISLEGSSFHIPTQREPWPQEPGGRFAGISSFGFGGTNAHVIVGEAPRRPAASPSGPDRTSHLLTLSAKSEQALRAVAQQYHARLTDLGAPAVADVCFTANTGRDHLPHRFATTASSSQELAAHLDAFLRGRPSPLLLRGEHQRAVQPRVIFIFPGQGSQYPGMGRQLYETSPVFRQALERCDALLRPHLDVPLLSVLYPESDSASPLIHQTRYTQPALFSLGYALAELWRSWGVKPDAVLGHSVGEYMAAHIAGVLSLEDALRLLATRSRLIQALPQNGAMAAIMADEPTVRSALGDEKEVGIAAINGPHHIVISGEKNAVQRVVEALQARGVDSRPLTVSHAFHSPQMDPMLADFEQAAREIRFQAPSLPIISNLTGEALTEAPDVNYWRRHLREPVQFYKSIQTAAHEGPAVFIELGPHDTLLNMAKRCVPESTSVWVSSLKRQQDAWQTVLGSLGALHVRGATIDWRELDRPYTRKRVMLPTYPFERQRYWLEVSPTPAAAQPASAAPAPAPAVSRKVRIQEEIRALVAHLLQTPPEKLGMHTPFLEMGADSIVLLDAIRNVEKRFGLKLSIRQLFEELTTLDAISTYLDRTLPADFSFGEPAAPPPAAAAQPQPSQPQAAQPEQPQPLPAPATVAPALAAGSPLEQVIQLQLQLMSQQLALLKGGTAVGALAANTALLPQALPAGAPAAVASPAPTSAPAQPGTSTGGSAAFSVGSVNGTPERELPPDQKRYLDTFIERYTRRTHRSKQNAIRYREKWSDVRWLMNFRPELKETCYPIVSTRSQGSRFWDSDGNEFVDLSMGFGVHLFGHNPPFILEALRKRLGDGMELGTQSNLGGQAAELICELTGMKRVTFCNSGTEAVMTALRVARAATGRTKIVMFTGSYHGHSDGTLVVGRMVGGAPQSLPMASGVAQHIANDVLVLPYGEDRTLEIIREHMHELAAVLVEPVQSRRPNLQPKAFLKTLREMTRTAKVPLIFDEIITGFRLHPGGAQAYYGIEADITTYGKIVGGGLPIGVVADRGGFVDRIDGGDWRYGDNSFPSLGTTFAAGTFCKHPLTMATTIATLKHLKKEGPALQERLNQRSASLAERLNAIFQREQVPVQVVYGGSVLRFTVAGNFSYLYQSLEMDLLYSHLIDHGVYIWEGRTCMLSTAHTDEDLDTIVRVVAKSVAEMRAGGFWPRPEPAASAPAPQQERAPAPAVPESATVSLSPTTEAQQQLWILSRMNASGSSAYNLSMSLRLSGSLQAELLQRAIQQVVERHEALRTHLNETGEQQHILPKLTAELPLEDLSTLPAAEQSSRLVAWYARESQTSFDLQRGPLFRTHLLKLAAQEHLLVLTAHHVVVDGWSLGVIVQEIAALYSALQEGKSPALPKPLQFSDYVRWLQRQTQSPEMAEHESYWLDQNVNEVPAIELPADHGRPAQRSFRGARETLRLNSSFSRALKETAQQQQSTLFILLLSVYNTFLHRLTGQDELLVGIPASGRGLEGSDHLVGYCAHLLPIVSHAHGEQTFPEYVRHLKQALYGAYEHQDYPFARLLSRLNLPRSSSHAPLVSVTFNLERPNAVARMSGLKTSFHPQPISFAAFDLSLNAIEVEDGLALDFEYNTDLFETETIRRWARCFHTLLEGVIANPQQRVADLPLLNPAERQHLLVAWNQPRASYKKDVLTHQFIEQQAAARPDKVAVEFEGQNLTYSALNQQANRLAHHLRTLGVRPGVLVGSFLERSPEVLITLLAIFKAGGAYVPLDPGLPQERLTFLLEDSRVAVVVTQGQLAERLPGYGPRTVSLNRDAAVLAAQPVTDPQNLATPNTPAYVIYTSGSTGEPKGVVVDHGALVVHSQDVRDHYRHSEVDKMLQFASFNFDASLEQILPIFMVGATLVLRGPQVWTPEELPRRIVEQQLTVVNFPTAYWQQLTQRWSESQQAIGSHRLRLVIVGGDTILPKVLELWQRGPLGAVRLLNAYGPTETVITATTFEVPAGKQGGYTRVPIGRPLGNRTLYVLDKNGTPVPIGVSGELHIGGELLAQGYLHRPALTSQRFIPDPFSDKPDARLYKTGDLVRYLSDGTVEFLGRTDHQVKVRGFRIELGEIESALSRHPSVQEVIVTLREESHGGQAGHDKRLVAYVVPSTPGGVSPTELRQFLLEKLPDYMIPAFFVLLKAMPLTASGKLDRQSLPAPEPEASASLRPFVAPSTPTEQTLADVWTKALRLQRVSIHDDFFELGGDSLLATQVASRIRDAFRVDLALERLFKATTIAGLAEHVDTLLWAAKTSTVEPAADASREEGEL
ncbi:non-ribosomal peptide synthetase/type I polyketide synthase [Hyalangium rubrum]|uniref:Amino acid adenylation domain-containing protein n=1 Tax=Hyalangium rubrum TaxID=3103134 RepID=A0ABU5H845_9BACT|nr:non-ribosomal peptide synthetase/type I polyketide synthase [Hyalangium sp. s54d21]MDY7229485.1 amino acid adenylation domain-containing protein [Hyalangium sp. s54d21]